MTRLVCKSAVACGVYGWDAEFIEFFFGLVSFFIRSDVISSRGLAFGFLGDRENRFRFFQKRGIARDSKQQGHAIGFRLHSLARLFRGHFGGISGEVRAAAIGLFFSTLRFVWERHREHRPGYGAVRFGSARP
jgi:hypothetical protein